jgi:hypothetical protein
MKKIVLMSAAVLLVAGTMVSCGKSSKGKMDGEWKVESWSDRTTGTFGGSTNSEEIKFSGTAYTETETSGGTTETITGTVQEASYSIKKDGTWSRSFQWTVTDDSFGMTFTTASTVISSGNWDFAAGVGEFKKNERVVFSTLNETYTEVVTSSFPTQTSSATQTFADGENSQIFVITESKKKSLALTATGESTYSSGGNSSSGTRTVTISLIAK